VGLVGFTALWTLLVVALFLAARAAWRTTGPEDRAAALSAASAVVVYLVHCYGDMGLGTWTSVFTVAPAFAVASRLAAATGAWPAARAREPRLVITVGSGEITVGSGEAPPRALAGAEGSP
jgi:hypothetical protein